MPTPNGPSSSRVTRLLAERPLARPDVMIFDWHGTLVDTLESMYRAIGDVLPQLDDLDLVRHLVPETACASKEDAKLVRYIRIFRRVHPRILAERRVSRTDIFDAVFGSDREAIAIAHAAYDRSYEKHFGKVKPFQDGVREYLETLSGAGIRLGIVTNRRRKFLDAELDALEGGSWRAFFAARVGGDEVRERKPDPEGLHLALSALGVPPGANVWFVGDGVADVATARAAGVTSVFYNGSLWEPDWFERTFGADAESPHPPPDAVVDDFDQLLDLVERSTDASRPSIADEVAHRRPERKPPRRLPPPRVDPDWHPAVADLTAPSLVLFDWHATLVDTLDAMYRAVDDTLPELDALGLMQRLVEPEQSRSIDDRKLVEYVRSFRKLHPKIRADRKVSRTDIFEILFGDDEDAKKLAHAVFNKHYRAHFGAVQPFESHVRDVLVGLRGLGIPVGVITNRDREFFLQELATVEGGSWASLFDTAVCGDDAERRKPHPDQVLLAISNLGARPDASVWYVGDSTTDTVAAKVAGITAVFFNGAQWDQPWLNKIFPGTERFPYKPDVVVNDFAEFWAMTLACRDKAEP